MTADVQVLDMVMYPAWTLQLYLCQLKANDGNTPKAQQTHPPGAPKAGGSSQGWWFAERSCPCLFFFPACSGPDTPLGLKCFPWCTGWGKLVLGAFVPIWEGGKG